MLIAAGLVAGKGDAEGEDGAVAEEQAPRASSHIAEQVEMAVASASEARHCT